MFELKTDLHLHTNDDREDYVAYSAFELIDFAAKREFDALAITNHNLFTFNYELEQYASDRGILLIPGIEATIERKHVLLLNAFKAAEKIKTFDDLYQAKNDGLFLIAPHPFFKARTCLEEKFIEHIELFDAVEFSFFYSNWLNLNRKAVKVCQDRDLPMVGNSDCHLLKYMGACHSIIYAELQTMDSVFEAIHNKSVEVISKPVFLPKLLWAYFEMFVLREKRYQKKKASVLPAFEFEKELEEVSV